MSPGARRWVRWLFNVGWVLLLVLTPVTCRAIGSANWVFDSLALSLVGAMVIVLTTSIIGLFDTDRRGVSILGLLVAGVLLGMVALFVGLVLDLTAAAFREHGVVETLLDGLAHLH